MKTTITPVSGRYGAPMRRGRTDDDIDADALVDLERTGDDYVIDGGTVAEAAPYSWDAIAFVKRVARLAEEGAYDSTVDTLDSLIHDARFLLGEIE